MAISLFLLGLCKTRIWARDEFISPHHQLVEYKNEAKKKSKLSVTAMFMVKLELNKLILNALSESAII